jgi:hypothetical protein
MSLGLYPALDSQEASGNILHVAPGTDGQITLVNGAISAGASAGTLDNAGLIKMDLTVSGVKGSYALPIFKLNET